jgi:hypothetical protein
MCIIFSATYTINVYFSFASGIIEEGGTREHAFGLVTGERTFHLTAETAMDKKEWVEVIRRVRTMPEQKVKSMLAQEVDPRKALLTLDLELIESVTATDQEKRYCIIIHKLR